MFTTVTTTTPGVSSKLEIFQDAELLTFYTFTAASDLVLLSERIEVVTDIAGISPTIAAIHTFMRSLRATFEHERTVDNFRQVVRRTNAKIEIVLGQGSDDWAAAEFDRDTKVITYFARPETSLTWPRFVRWVDVQVEFLELAREG